jgi:serine/threonine protein phosphatase PrpC
MSQHNSSLMLSAMMFTAVTGIVTSHYRQSLFGATEVDEVAVDDKKVHVVVVSTKTSSAVFCEVNEQVIVFDDDHVTTTTASPTTVEKPLTAAINNVEIITPPTVAVAAAAIETVQDDAEKPSANESTVSDDETESTVSIETASTATSTTTTTDAAAVTEETTTDMPSSVTVETPAVEAPSTVEVEEPELEVPSTPTVIINNRPKVFRSTASIPAIKTPSPSKKRVYAQKSLSAKKACADKVVETSNSTAKATKYPKGKGAKVEQAFRIASNKVALSPKMSKKLTKLLKNNPWLLTARSNNMGNSCPDSYTLLMAAAYGGQVEAANIVLEALGSAGHAFSELSLPLDRDHLGKCALHIAAQNGNMDLVDLLLPLTMPVIATADDGTPIRCDPPVDSRGMTPLGYAITSQSSKARANKKLMEEKLYTPYDFSIQGEYHSPQNRMTTLSPSLQVAVGTAEKPGRRVDMEDAMCQETWKQVLHVENGTSTVDFTLLGVCDGHGDGGEVSEFVATHVAPILCKIIENDSATDGNVVDLSSEEYWSKIWTATSIQLDAKLKSEKLDGGSTACFALISKDFIVVANTGDSRCILVQEEGGVKPLSFDHKPEDKIETDRVTKAGMEVARLEFGGEVYYKIKKSSGNTLSVARAYGDFDYKTNEDLGPEAQAVTCVPDVVVHRREQDQDQFLVLACDGIWDVMSNEDVHDFVKNEVEKMGENPLEVDALLPEIGDALLDKCLEKGSLDNMSAMVVSLKPDAEPLLLAPKKLVF